MSIFDKAVGREQKVLGEEQNSKFCAQIFIRFFSPNLKIPVLVWASPYGLRVARITKKIIDIIYIF